MFNVTNVPSGTAVAGPTGEQIRYVMSNAGTNANPQWYLAEWNSSKLWQYDVNPYTGGGSFNPSVINASNLVIVHQIPINPNVPSQGWAPNGASVSVPYGSTITVNANVPINISTIGGQRGGIGVAGQGITTYDWNISLPWLNTMPRANQHSQECIATSGTNPVSMSTSMAIMLQKRLSPVGFRDQQRRLATSIYNVHCQPKRLSRSSRFDTMDENL
jgi:hypothetical protein